MYNTLKKNVTSELVSLVVMTASSGYAVTPAPAKPAVSVVQPACQSSWYQCIKQDQLNPKPGYISSVMDQYLDNVGGKIAISLEDVFAKKRKNTNEELCREALNRVYNLMTSPAEQKEEAARNYFAAQRNCPKEMPNKSYPYILFKSEKNDKK